MSNRQAAAKPARLSSGIEGIDDILGGGLTPHRMYLVEGAPGTGKTTLALQFLLKGVEEGQGGLYITLSETRSELISVAESHGWNIGGFRILELVSDEGLDPQEPDGRAIPLPGTRPLIESDVAALRFDTALRGYRMAEVDSALRRAASLRQ